MTEKKKKRIVAQDAWFKINIHARVIKKKLHDSTPVCLEHFVLTGQLLHFAVKYFLIRAT